MERGDATERLEEVIDRYTDIPPLQTPAAAAAVRSVPPAMVPSPPLLAPLHPYSHPTPRTLSTPFPFPWSLNLLETFLLLTPPGVMK